MKIKTTIIVAALVLLVGACKYFQHKAAAVEANVSYPMLDSASIFNSDSVAHFFPSAKAIAYSRQLYLSAIDLFVNKKKAKESLPIFLRSLRIAPGAYAYYKYADALYEDGQYKIADDAYHFSWQLDPSMVADALMGRAKCASMMNDTTGALGLLGQALESYPYDFDQLKQDKAFAKFTEYEPFKLLEAHYTNTDETRTAAMFALFEKNFNKVSLPYSIPPDSVPIHSGKMIDFRYVDFVPGMAEGQYSRSVEREYQYMAELDLSPDYKTFIYRSIDVNGDTILPVHHYLMVVDETDSVVSNQEIACSCSPLTIKTAAIDTDGVIEVKEILQTWKEDPLEKGYAGNQVVKQEVKSTSYYHVGEFGRIIQLKERPNGPAQAQASNDNK